MSAAAMLPPAPAPHATLTARIRSDIQQRIVSGAWRPGTRIPFEHELAEQYRCSRMTVNKALSALAESGLIVRRRKAGSFVAAPVGEQAVMEIQDFSSDAARRGLIYAHEITGRRLRRLDAAAANAAGLPRGARVLQVLCRHVAGGLPTAFEDRIISLAAIPDAASASFDTMPPGTWLLQRVPWNHAEHTLRARRADAAMAGVLEVDPGEACLVLRRRTWHGGALVTMVEITFAGERQQLVGGFSP